MQLNVLNDLAKARRWTEKKPPGGIGVSGVDPVQGMNLSQVQSLRSAGDVLQARHGFVPERLGDTEAGSLPLPRGQYARFEGGTEITGMFSLRVRSGLEARRLHLRRNGLGAKACYWFFRNYVSETFKCEWSVEQPCLVSTLHSRWCSQLLHDSC
jgi:hypothetical protein